MGESKRDHASSGIGVTKYRKKPDRTDDGLAELTSRLEEMKKKQHALIEENKRLKRVCKSLKTIHGIDTAVSGLEQYQKGMQRNYRELYESEKAIAASLKRENFILKEKLEAMQNEAFEMEGELPSEGMEHYNGTAVFEKFAAEIAGLKKQMMEAHEKLENQLIHTSSHAVRKQTMAEDTENR